MTTTIAQIAGPYLLLTGLGILLSTGFYITMIQGQSKADPTLLNLSGAVHFIIGMIILVHHFKWSSALEIIVTLTGCAAVLKGAGLIVVPDFLIRAPVMSKSRLRFSGLIFCLVGAYLAFMGFGGERVFVQF